MDNMAADRIEGVNPTRMEFLEITRRRRLAEKGHKLLTEKRDALVVQFFELVERRKELKKDVEGAADAAYKSLFAAQAKYGTTLVEEVALSSQGSDEIDGRLVSIMGVLVPHMEFHGEREGLPYNPMDTGAFVDQTAADFQKAITQMVKLAEAEGAIERMALEIEKTKRRVNALEHIFIPRLKATEKYISMQLEEREREDFFRRKRIKSIMEGKELKEGREHGEAS
ncbi:MAG: V-type ATP synthase subunit D, partial [Candidatus Thermoplasmatota archaeon]|nr:V-type ATP synthase subunit D [Candidatus Thermoplasmatota archaeon]